MGGGGSRYALITKISLVECIFIEINYIQLMDHTHTRAHARTHTTTPPLEVQQPLVGQGLLIIEAL
jgi:hypothetical protein